MVSFLLYTFVCIKCIFDVYIKCICIKCIYVSNYVKMIYFKLCGWVDTLYLLGLTDVDLFRCDPTPTPHPSCPSSNLYK